MECRRIRFGKIGQSPVVDFAAQELTRYLKRMDPKLIVDLLQVEKPEDSYEGLIWLGRDASLESKLPKVENPTLDDGIAVEVKNGQGFITGTNDRSVLMAAYRFLKALGCDWVRPGADGERIPLRAVTLPSVKICEAASYRHRGVCIEGADAYENIADMIDYLPKVGMNEYFIQFLVPATFFERWYWHENNPYLAKEGLTRQDVEAMTASLETEIARRGLGYHKTGHGWTCEPFGIDGTSWDADRQYDIAPETRQYLAQVNGKRELWGNIPLNTNLCYSNPEVRGKMTDAITEYCLNNPQVGSLHFWLADGSNNHCECEQCAQKRPADWYVLMLNELDEKMTAAGVNTKVVFLIYVDLLWEPVMEQLKNPQRFIMMFAPITRTYAKSYGDCLQFDGEIPDYDRNQLQMPSSLEQNLEHLRRWQAKFQGDSFDYDYHLMWAHVGDLGYEKCARNLFQDMKDLHKIGLQGMMSCQVQRAFFPTALPFNMMARALWDETCNFEEEALAYYHSAFGREGDLAHRYLKTVSDLFLLYDQPSFGGGRSLAGPYCQDYVALRQEIEAFQPVIRRNIEAGGAYRKDWKLLELHSAVTAAAAQCLELIERGEQEECRRAALQLFDLLNRNEMAMQKVMDVNNTLLILKRMLAPEV